MAQVVRKQVERITEELPKHNEHDEVRARHHAEEDEDVESNEGEKAAVTAILVHVIDRIAIDDRADRRNQDHHHRAEPVDVKANGSARLAMDDGP